MPTIKQINNQLGKLRLKMTSSIVTEYDVKQEILKHNYDTNANKAIIVYKIAKMNRGRIDFIIWFTTPK